MYPVYIHIGGDPAKKDQETAMVQKAITLKEKHLGRPLTSTEILHVFGEVIEPDPSKRKFIGSGAPRGPQKLWRPGS